MILNLHVDQPAPSVDCLLQDATQIMLSEPGLRAISFELKRQRVSYASQPGADIRRAVAALKALVESSALSIDASGCDPAAASCPACRQIDHPFQPPPGFRLITIPDGVLLERVSCQTSPRFWRWGQVPWIRIEPREPELPEADAWKKSILMASACGLFGGAAFLWEKIGGDVSPPIIGLYLLSYFSGAFFPIQEVWERLQKRVIDIHFLMIAVAIGAASIGAWWEGAVLLFLFSFSGALEEFAMGRTRRAIQSLFKDTPKIATVLSEDGREEIVEVDLLKVGQKILIKPGDAFPVDAEVVEGESESDESTLTGESVPVPKAKGDPVSAGTLNLWGRLDCRVLRPASESSLQKIIRLIEDAQNQKAPSQRFTDRFGTRYTEGVIALAAIMFLVWWLAFGWEAKLAFYHAMTLLVVASPCALVLSIPSAILAAIASGARNGILFQGGAAIEKLAEVQRIALDKTGTLTTGNLELSSIEPTTPGQETRLLELLISLEQNSNHPLARAIVREGKRREVAPLPITEFRSLTGMGVEGKIHGKFARAGKRSLFTDSPFAQKFPDPDVGTTEILIESDGISGRVLLRDEIRLASRPTLAHLKKLGLRSAMLTGDRPEAAQHVADLVGVDEVFAGLTPEEKVGKVTGWSASGQRVAMVGDGVNDAPALAAAHVGIAMGLRGSDAALEQADVVLMHDRLENVVTAYLLSRKARRIIQQNLAISLGVIIVLVVAALGAVIPLPVGVIGHEGSTVIVVLNSLRLLRLGKNRGNLKETLSVTHKSA
jgi:Cd2+/Zn2+-exporting ATPase